MQLVGGNRILIAQPGKNGFREYDLATKKVVREKFDAQRYTGAMSAVRLPDGRTVLACEGGRGKGVRLYVFDAQDKETAEWKFPEIQSLRLLRATPKGNFLLGSSQNHVIEVSPEGKSLRTLRVPNGAFIFQASELSSGNLLASCGYGGFLAELDKEGKVVRKFGGKPEPAGVKYIFMSQFQRLANGNTLVATWTGHGAGDSRKGQQVVEFDPDGKVVWKWHDAGLAGSILGVIAVDGIDPSEFLPAY
jgi:hypothetical protein